MNPSSNTFSVIFHLRVGRPDNEKVPVYARVTIDGKGIEISLKHKIANWGKRTGDKKDTGHDEDDQYSNFSIAFLLLLLPVL